MAGSRTDLAKAVWRRSTHSSPTGQNCVQVAVNLGGVVAVRDSKDPEGGKLIVQRSVWSAFVDEVRAGTGVRDGRP